jgi:polyvinyl alcohol dehydrogenase (cytochrome)
MKRTACLAALAALCLFASPAHAADSAIDPMMGQMIGKCPSVASVTDFYTEGWGFNAGNERYQPRTTINKGNVDQLKLKWAFKLEGGMSPHSYPVVTEDTVFVGNEAGILSALDRETGCVRWTYDADSLIRTAVVHGMVEGEDGPEAVLFFGTMSARTHAVSAATGERRWVTDVRDHSMGMLTGSPTFHDGQVYVPVSSSEVMMAIMPWYGCCTFRGTVVALDASTGALTWRTHVVEEEPKETWSHYFFVQNYGPSGVPIWSAPTIDANQGLLFVGTGENYSNPGTAMSDAIVAMDLKTGDIEWVQQYTADDTFNASCIRPGHPNCPENAGPDLDFGAPPILSKTTEGVPIMLAGQKSGGVYALNPVNGERIWERYFGRGGLVGGVHWGMAVNQQRGLVYAPINDMQFGMKVYEGTPEPGLYALDIATGELRWSTPITDTCGDRERCNSGLSAAIVATEDLVWSGGLDGNLRAFDAETGAVVWQYDTWREYDATDGTTANGATIDTDGPMIAGNMLFIQSGYARQLLTGGNALLAFELPQPSELNEAGE